MQANIRDEINIGLGNPSDESTRWICNTNDLGLRNPPVGPKSGRCRILVIGDSTTFGLGVDDHETWPAQLQALLEPEAEIAEVINAGCPATTSYQGLRYLVARGFDLDPDLVIFTYGYNDACPAPFADLHPGTPGTFINLVSELLHSSPGGQARSTEGTARQQILKRAHIPQSTTGSD